MISLAPDRKGRLLQLAELRAAYDAVTHDITVHEQIRATIEDRLAEARAHRVLLAHQIRALRGAAPP